jgi:hypothetical protein
LILPRWEASILLSLPLPEVVSPDDGCVFSVPELCRELAVADGRTAFQVAIEINSLNRN